MKHAKVTLVLLPGLDGTGRLFEDFISLSPTWGEPHLVTYPTHEPMGYDALAAYVAERLPPSDRMILMGESFSGLIALRVAARKPPQGIVLVASFIRSPLSWWSQRVPWSLVFRFPIPLFMLRCFLHAPNCDPKAVARTRSAVKAVSPRVLAYRLRSIIRSDDSADLRAIKAPLLYLQGTQDRIVKARSLQEILELLPETEVVKLAAPHLILQHNPEGAWQAIEGFAQKMVFYSIINLFY